MPAPGAEIIRRLLGTERMVAMANALYRGNFNVVAAIELEGPVTAELLQRAIERLQRAHECLRVEVVAEPGSDDQWVFRKTDERPQLEQILSADPDAWKEPWDRAANNPLEGLAWRVTWVHTESRPTSHVVITFNHAISDASSLALFFDGLLEAMHHDGERGRTEAASRSILPTLHRLVRARWPIAALSRIAWFRYFRRLRTMPFDAQLPAPISERRWHGSFRTLEGPEVQRLLERCRAEKITIGTALSAATILQLAERVRTREGSDPFDVALCTSIDLRRFESPPIDPGQMGLLVSVIHSFFRPRSEHTVWGLGREIAAELRRAIAADEHRNLSLLPALIGPAAAAGLSNENQGRPKGAALLVSNMGRIAGLSHGAFRATRMFATGSQASWGSTLLLCVTTVGGRMCLHLGHPSPSVSQASGEAFLDGILSRVGAVAPSNLQAPAPGTK